MAKDRVIVRSGGLIGIGVIGEAPDFYEGLKKYQRAGRFRREIDLTPVLKFDLNEDAHLFFAGNMVRGKNLANITGIQYAQVQPGTSLVCYGIGHLVNELVEDFSRVIGLRYQEPTREFESEVRTGMTPLEASLLMARIRAPGNERAVLAAAFKAMQHAYRHEKDIQVSQDN